MKILLVDNNTRHLQNLNKSLSGHEVDMQIYEPGIDFRVQGKDLVILSGGGGEGKEMHDKHTPDQLWYEDQMNFVHSCKKPIIGICMGFEVIAGAYGSKVEKMAKGIEAYINLHTTLKGRQEFNKINLRQYEAHDWSVKNVSQKYFEVLAESETGIEMIRHKKRPILATQFHPEFEGGSLQLRKLINTFSIEA